MRETPPQPDLGPPDEWWIDLLLFVLVLIGVIAHHAKRDDDFD